MTKGPRRDTLKKAWREKEEQKRLDSIPISQADLKELFDYLEREDSPPCDNTLRDTIQFLEKKKINVELVVQWLRERGGHCDCAVIYDVEEEFGPTVGR